MRIVLLTAVFIASTSLGAVTLPPTAAVAPCTTATDACVGWVVHGKGPARTMVYSSYKLTERNDNIRRALIMVHGTNRNADHYFSTAVAAAFLAGALEDTIVVAPHLIINTDPKQADEVVWPGGGDSWRSGGMSPSHPDLSSFDVADELLRTFASKSLFPNMKAIVVTGHSAGGQYATRYAMANKVHETLGVPVTYVVANPSSYAWPDGLRPLPQEDAEPAAAKDGWSLTPDTAAHTRFTFGPYDAAAKNCANYNRWPAGLENRNGYTAKMSDEQLKKRLIARPTTFLVGQVDTLPLGGFDSSCTAMAQGPTRRARGEAYAKFLRDQLGATHEIQVVSECGHNDRCIFTTDAVFPKIFPAIK
ncbi:MAG TPA: alpha/beta hydrolase [Vicinamibacterales bacterium]|nr:alpha/beta hydrolase [Vicinamibacterales bacterium]